MTRTEISTVFPGTQRFWTNRLVQVLRRLDACAKAGLQSTKSLPHLVKDLLPLTKEFLDWLGYVADIEDLEGLVLAVPDEYFWYLALGKTAEFMWTEDCSRLRPMPDAWHLWWYFVYPMDLQSDESEDVLLKPLPGDLAPVSTGDPCILLDYKNLKHKDEVLALAVDVLQVVCAQASPESWGGTQSAEACLVNFGLYLVRRFDKLLRNRETWVPHRALIDQLQRVLWDKLASWPVFERMEEDLVHTQLFLPIPEAIFVARCAQLQFSQPHVAATLGRNPALIMCAMVTLSDARWCADVPDEACASFLRDFLDARTRDAHQGFFRTWASDPFPSLMAKCFYFMDFAIPSFGRLAAMCHLWRAADDMFFRKRDMSVLEPYLVHAVLPPMAEWEAMGGCENEEELHFLREVHARWSRWSCCRAVFVSTVVRARAVVSGH
jgi:hypothetical protein